MTLHQFLNTSYTAYHTTANICEILDKNGFAKLILGQNWDLKTNSKYYVTCNGSSVVAFVLGKRTVFNVCESHTDSPSFKVKGNGVITGNGVSRVNTEKYGGGLLYSFFDRQLKIAGRIAEKTENGIVQRLYTSDYNVVIPSLAIHHNPTANDNFSVNAQCDTLPVFGINQSDVYKRCGTDVVDADLYVVPATEAFVAGADNELLCSARLDNLTSVYSSITALCHCNPTDIAVCACLDNEEVGSGTRQGSPDFIDAVLSYLSVQLCLSETEKLFARENGFVLSVDNGHAVHPAHPEKSDPVFKTYMGKGVVVKHNVNYSTDGVTSALFKRILDEAGVPCQDYYNNSAVRCGSTLGLATARRLGMKACDIGIAQLAMHSACETCAIADVNCMTDAVKAFFQAALSDNGETLTIK